MEPLRHLRRLALVAAVGALATALGGPPAAAAPPLVVSEVPEWRAPGGRFVVKGWAGAEARVALLAGGRIVARTASGARGGFALRARAPARVGRYALEVRSGGEATALGPLRVRPLRLAAVGDVTFGNGVARAIAAYGPRYPWLSVAPVLRRADVAFANLEGAVSTRGSPVPGKQYTFRGPPAALAAAARFAGVDAVSLANNHSLDFGRTAFLDTIRHARAYGVLPVGGGSNLAIARRPGIVAAGGIRVALLGFSDVRPLGFDAGPGRPGATPAFPSYVAPDVRTARRRADVVVVYFHWGIERSTRPNARQAALARLALDAGATVVLGAHPHVLQPIARSGRRLVAWSLGNFVFAANSRGTERTGILRVDLARDGVRGYGFRRARIHGVQPRLLP